jgi:hypothetical protein
MAFILIPYLIRRFRKNLRDRNAPDGPNNEPQQPKLVPLCEHQLAAVSGVNSDGVLSSAIPSLEHLQFSAEQRGPKHCPECIAEKKSARIYRWKLLLSLLVPNIMASMDATITATALPTIASQFCKSAA